MADPAGRFQQLRPLSAGRDFHEGFAAPWRGLRFMSQHPGLWRYGVLPVLLNLLITGLLLVGLIAAGVYGFAAVHQRLAEGWWRLPLEVLAGAALAVVLLGMTFVAWIALQSALCAFFYDLLARRVELQLGVKPGELCDVPLWPQAVDSLRDVAGLLVVNVACLVVQFVPVVGTVLGLCGSCYFTARALGLEYLDYPLALRGQRRAERRLFGRRHRWHTLGLGAAVALVAFVPIVNAVFLTTAVSGAVLLHRRIAGNSPIGLGNANKTQKGDKFNYRDGEQ